MGLGPSYIPHCKSTTCEHHDNVVYIAKIKLFSDDARFERLHPWWIQTTLSDNVSLYHSCEFCFSHVDNRDKSLFIYNPQYSCHGM